TFVARAVCPFGLVRVASVAVKVEKFMARSNVTRTLVTVFVSGPMGTALTIRGAVTGAPTAAARLTIPPVATLPASAVDFSAVLRLWAMTWVYFQVGFFAQTRAAAPVTNGVDIEVPLISP